MLMGLGCALASPGELTHAEAARLLTGSSLLGAVESIQILLPHGCLSVSKDVPIDRINPRKEPSVVASRQGGDAFAREIQLDVVDFELAEAPLTTGTPLEGCESVWLEETGRSGQATAAQLKMVAWKTVLNDKGQAAGLQPGQTLLYRRQTLVGVEQLIPEANGTMTGTYSWRWEPTPDGAHLGIPSGAPTRATVRFRRVRGRWEIASQ